VIKRNLLISIVSILAFLLILPSSYAQTPSQELEKSTRAVVIDSSLTITVSQDGRVLPVTNAKNLTEKQLDVVLTKMKVENNTIDILPLEMKKQIISRGGVSIPLNTEMRQYYNSADGKKHLITEENKKEIELIKQKDVNAVEKMSAIGMGDKGISALGMGSDGSGSFFGSSLLMFLGGPNSVEYEYEYYNYFSYNAYVSNTYKDIFAHAWQYHTVSWGNYGNYSSCILPTICGNGTYSLSHDGSTTGTKMTISLNGGSNVSKHEGYFSEIVRIPQSQKYSSGTWVVKYAHPWTLFIPSVNFGAASVAFGAFIGDEWDWSNTFTIGF